MLKYVSPMQEVKKIQKNRIQRSEHRLECYNMHRRDLAGQRKNKKVLENDRKKLSIDSKDLQNCFERRGCL